MLDYVCVFHKGGLVLWSEAYKPLSSNVVDTFVHTVLLEQRAGVGATGNSLALDEYMIKCAIDNEYDIVFMVRNQLDLGCDVVLTSPRRLCTRNCWLWRTSMNCWPR